MKKFTKTRGKAFQYAIEGLFLAVKTQKNTWIYLVVTLLVISLSFVLDLSNDEWAILIITIAFVWSAEIINTSIEAIIDLVSPDHHPLAKAAKDLGAAAVLVAAISSVIVGLLILGPTIWSYIFH
ncbi:MAG: diacylglycerol kinase family protein [Methanoregulaceae archaeon]|jgi:diacylglycerol kinase|nr:diacylglycerol kinase family protein [Methanoregulaceae archaeon]